MFDRLRQISDKEQAKMIHHIFKKILEKLPSTPIFL